MNGFGRGSAFCATVCIGLAGMLDAPAADLPPLPRLAAKTEPTAGAAPRVKESAVAWDVLGRSTEGRVIEYAQFGDGKRQVLVIGALRGDEPEGVGLAQSLAVHLSRFPRRIDDVTITIVRDPNPDGRARRTAGNARGVELDRNFLTSGWRKASEVQRPVSGKAPESEPESRALAELINDIRPDRVVILGTGQGRTSVSYSGPAEFVARQVALEADGQAIPLNDLRATGSLATLAGVDRGIPTLQIAVAPRPAADAIWSAHKRALLTAVGCGSPIEFAPVVARFTPPPVKMQTPTLPAARPEVAVDNSPPAQPLPFQQLPSQAAPAQLSIHPAGDVRPIGPPASGPMQTTAPVPTFPPPQVPFPPVQSPLPPSQSAPAVAVDPNAPQPLSFSELRHGRPAVGVVSPRSARRQRGEPTPAPSAPSDNRLSDVAASSLAASDIAPAPEPTGSIVGEDSPQAPPSPRIQRLPSVNLFAPPRRQPPRRALPQAGLPQPPIPFYPQTGY